ncbi:complement factor H-like [Procambarus clarkii]|uniref:complement factor H-like n=1 Tax=Procambarus clarkii TaxID=6728 RepID=UPI00374300BA
MTDGVECSPTVCLGDPVVQNATVDLQNVMWAVGEAPTATCFEHYMFLQEATKTQPIICTSQGWENRTGCVQVCDQPPNVPNAITAWTPSQVWPVGSTVNGSCNYGAVIIPGGDLQFTVQCTNSGWTTNSCQKVKPSLPCSVEPKVDNANTSWENRTWGVGNIITATCSFPLYYFNDSTQQQQLECTKDGWENITGCSKHSPLLLLIRDIEYVFAINISNMRKPLKAGTILLNERDLNKQALVGRPGKKQGYWDVDPRNHQIVAPSPSSGNKSAHCRKQWTHGKNQKMASVECREEPDVNNTNSTWVDRDWYVGENVTVTCIPDHWFISDDTDHLQVTCTWDGWTNLSGCEKVNIGKECSMVPLVENANTTWRNRTWFVGDNVTATCLPGFIFVVNNASQSPITCTAQGWQNLTGCQIVCEEELSVEGAMTDWSSTVVWPLGAKVNATCLQGHYILPEGNLTQTVECTSQGWQNATPCEPGCTEELALEAANGSAIWPWETRVWSLDENLTASCSDQYLTHNGTNTTNFTCTPTGWLILAPCLRGKLRTINISQVGSGYPMAHNPKPGTLHTATIPINPVTHIFTPLGNLDSRKPSPKSA